MQKAQPEKRQSPRITATFPIQITPEFSGETIDLSETGLRFILEKPLLLSKAQVKIELSPEGSIETEFKVIWNKHLVNEGKFAYGVCFVRLKDKDIEMLRKVSQDINLEQIEGFFNMPLPKHIRDNYKNTQISKKLNQREIMEIIDFAPPFLRIDKMIVFDINTDSILQTRSLGAGIVTTKDTAGHYNDTIFLAMCGWLMASSASVHLAVLFPSHAPQVVRADGVKPLLSLENNEIWKPSNKGTPFLIETNVVKKKLRLIIVRTNITFGKILYGTIEELRLVSTKKDSTFSAKEIPLL